MNRYAASTDVSTSRSRDEIENTLCRYGATGFGYAWEGDAATVQFLLQRRHIRFVLPLPDRNAKEFTRSATGRPRIGAAAEKAWEQACRQAWRALALVIKAKLEAVEAKITTFDDEFMSAIVLPDGRTTGQWMRPQIEAIMDSRAMPRLLPDYSASTEGGGNGH